MCIFTSVLMLLAMFALGVELARRHPEHPWKYIGQTTWKYAKRAGTGFSRKRSDAAKPCIDALPA